MVSKDSVDEQLKKIDFSPRGWNRSEAAELHNILLPDEEIYECVNGLYEGGFALLLASDVRVLLIDKKPMGFLNVEDLRFDMINEIDYNHRLMGAAIKITTGSKTLNFRSYNKDRLRKLIGHVQHCMADNKKKPATHAEDQKQHLEQINQQLQTYLVAQYKQQQKMQEQLSNLETSNEAAKLPKLEEAEMSPQLKDYLYAQGLMNTYQQQIQAQAPPAAAAPAPTPAVTHAGSNDNQLDEIYADGIQEVFGRHQRPQASASVQQADDPDEINPMQVAYSKLPQALRSKKFGVSMPSLPSPFPLGQGQQPAARR